MPPKNLIGPAIRRLRAHRDWSQDALAAHCQRLGWAISRGTLAKIESGVRRVNDGEVALFASALDICVADLFPATSPKKFCEEALEVARHSGE
jgi:transcriptional regulator with XRE-family HTH domain